MVDSICILKHKTGVFIACMYTCPSHLQWFLVTTCVLGVNSFSYACATCYLLILIRESDLSRWIKRECHKNTVNTLYNRLTGFKYSPSLLQLFLFLQSMKPCFVALRTVFLSPLMMGAKHPNVCARNQTLDISL